MTEHPFKPKRRMAVPMAQIFRDPKIDLVRGSLLDGLSRLCLSLALGHFLCLIPLYLDLSRLAGQPGAVFTSRCITAITISGLLLTLVAFLCRFKRLRAGLPYVCLGLLFLQTAYFFLHGTGFSHPVTMLFPLLCSLATPIVGRRASFVMAAITSVLFLGCFFFVLHSSPSELPSLLLLELIVFFSAYLTEVLWEGLLRRERSLQEALASLRQKNDEMELWVQRLGQASRLISAGHSTELPGSPPSEVFAELTRTMGQMQEKLSHYFSELLLKDRLNSLGVLASGLAHELNTPLTTMQFLLNREGIPEEARELLSQEIARMGGIARGLLSFARPKEEETFDLNAVVRATEPLLKSFERKDLALAIALDAEPLLVRGTSNLVQQVVLNLFHNAADACEGRPHARVTVRARRDPQTGGAYLVIQDNGCGIEPGTLSRILDPFFTTKPPGKGTGLGLFIVHQIVQRHHAVLTITSEAGKGTEVTIHFPGLESKREAA